MRQPECQTFLSAAGYFRVVDNDNVTSPSRLGVGSRPRHRHYHASVGNFRCLITTASARAPGLSSDTDSLHGFAVFYCLGNETSNERRQTPRKPSGPDANISMSTELM